MKLVDRPGTDRLSPAAVAAVDSTAQAVDLLSLGGHLRDALARVDAAGLRPLDAPGALVVAGMGGSAVGARLAVGVLADRLRRPVVVADGYDLPSWIGRDAMVLCSSYSGTTEETLTCYEQARRRGAPLLAASSGGALTERAIAEGVPVIPLPSGLQPRAAVGYSLICALEAAALAGAGPSLRAEVEPAATLVDALAADWGPGGPESGLAKALARRLAGSVPVITGAGLTAPIAYRWKCQCNENAKVPAFSSVLPEADHNEICGWRAAGELGAFSAVFLEDRDHTPEIARRFELTARLTSAGARTVERVAGHGSGRLQRLLSLVLLGDLVSLYLAVLRGADPVEIRAIAELKTALQVRDFV
jgi:glucose/mannose-6-phosphate isomerase